MPICSCLFLLLVFLHRLVDHADDGVCRLPIHPLGGVGVGVQGEDRAVVVQGVGEGLRVHTVLQGQCRKGTPLFFSIYFPAKNRHNEGCQKVRCTIKDKYCMEPSWDSNVPAGCFLGQVDGVDDTRHVIAWSGSADEPRRINLFP